MKHCHWRNVLILVFCMAVILVKPAWAEAGGTRLGVIDIQRLITESIAAQSIQTQLKSYRDKFQDEFTKLENELRDNQKTLSEQKASLSQEEFTSKKEEFQQKLFKTRGLLQKRKGTLDRAFTKAIQDLKGEIAKISAGVADEKGIDIIITRENVVIADKSTDLTPVIMERLNASLTEVKLKVEEK